MNSQWGLNIIKWGSDLAPYGLPNQSLWFEGLDLLAKPPEASSYMHFKGKFSNENNVQWRN